MLSARGWRCHLFCKVTSIFLDAMLALPNQSVANGVKTTPSDKVRGMQAAVIFTTRISRMAGWRHWGATVSSCPQGGGGGGSGSGF